jgi:SAM-dependent methyltransferase
VRIPAACAAALLAALWLAAPQAEAQRGAGDVVYVPTPQPVVEVMLEMAAVGPADTVIDLGSGDGRVVVTAAAKHGARGVGVELDRYLLKLAADNARRAGVADRVRFLEQDLFETDISGATVVTLYLLPEMNQRLQPRLLALRPGARVVIHDYPLERWSPDARRVIPVPGKTVGHPGESHLFLHVVPARLAGEWQARAGSGGEATVYEFAFEQEFQYVEGTVRGRGQTARIPEFRLAGDRRGAPDRPSPEGRSEERAARRDAGDRGRRRAARAARVRAARESGRDQHRRGPPAAAVPASEAVNPGSTARHRAAAGRRAKGAGAGMIPGRVRF